jgi:hypothetical protein
MDLINQNCIKHVDVMQGLIPLLLAFSNTTNKCKKGRIRKTISFVPDSGSSGYWFWHQKRKKVLWDKQFIIFIIIYYENIILY